MKTFYGWPILRDIISCSMVHPRIRESSNHPPAPLPSLLSLRCGVNVRRIKHGTLIRLIQLGKVKIEGERERKRERERDRQRDREREKEKKEREREREGKRTPDPVNQRR